MRQTRCGVTLKVYRAWRKKHVYVFLVIKDELTDTIIDYMRTLSANEQQFGGSYSSFDH